MLVVTIVFAAQIDFKPGDRVIIMENSDVTGVVLGHMVVGNSEVNYYVRYDNYDIGVGNWYLPKDLRKIGYSKTRTVCI